jgi:membrane associated rhomboid family serine protease
MIFPLAHEDMGHRRLPFVTIFVVVACFATHVIVTPIEAARQRAAREALRDALVYHAEHPYLEVHAPIDSIIGSSRVHVKNPREKPISEEARVTEQTQLDELGRMYLEKQHDRPLFHYGYVPKRGDVVQIFTHLFLHGGWLHLISNMWFLWLCGVNLEDRWGRAAFGSFYVMAGIAAALTELLIGGVPDVPRIGASGAVAGAMGAFMIIHAKTRIRFITFFSWRPILFTARAYVMLPLWFAVELLLFKIAPPGEVARGAHIGGFMFGAIAALVLRKTGVDQKLDSTIENSMSMTQDPRIVFASDLMNEGRAVEAVALLDKVIAEFPSNIDAQMEMLRAAKAARMTEREIAAYGRLMQLYVRENQNSQAISFFRELCAQRRLAELPAAVLMTMAQVLEKSGMERESAQAYEALHQGTAGSLVAVKAMIAQAKIEARLGAVEHARELLTSARESPFSTKELDDVVDVELGRLS